MDAQTFKMTKVEQFIDALSSLSYDSVELMGQEDHETERERYPSHAQIWMMDCSRCHWEMKQRARLLSSLMPSVCHPFLDLGLRRVLLGD